MQAILVGETEYDLVLSPDSNSCGHTQWFYFKVIYKDVPLRAEKTKHRIKFNILNLAKTASLYEQGMRPCVWSKLKNQHEGLGWHRACDNITYT